MTSYKLCLCYDGSRYRGWQKQGNTSGTLQEKLETLLSRLLEQDIELAASGRTDAGVHARMQVCSFRAETDKRCEELLALIRRHLPDDIGAISLEPAPARFHARLNCVEKTYMYQIWNSDMPNVFRRKYMYAYPGRLDLDAMNRAAALLCGRHDFSAFCSNRNMKKSAVRDLKSIEISVIGEELRISLTGDGFLYNMVRIIVGTLLEVGAGDRDYADMEKILLSLCRENAGPTAPALGLTLWDVRY